MGDKTGIQWTDATWNPTTGCRKVSAGCANCYAERVFPRAYAGQTVPCPRCVEGYCQPSGNFCPTCSGTGKRPRRFTDVRTHPERLDQPLRWKRPRRVFVDSMSDLFHEDVPDDFIVEVFGRMASAQRHTFQVLTKRPERMRALVTPEFHERVARSAWETCERLDITLSYQFPLPNVWLGVSVEDQAAADERVPVLLDTPAAVRFLSCEPLIGPVDLGEWLAERIDVSHPYLDAADGARVNGMERHGDCWYRYDRLDWLIVGGESGPKARPMDLAWARSLVEQGRSAGVPVFVKQLGRRPVWDHTARAYDGARFPLRDSHGGDPDEWPEDLRVREFPEAVGA